MPNTSFLLIILFGLLAIGLAGYQYLYKNRRSAKYFWVLTFLRATSIFSLLLLLINPEFTSTSFFVEKPDLVIAIDNSASISNSNNAERVKTFVQEITSDPEIQKRFNIQPFTFGKNLKSTDSLHFSESETNIQGTLKELNNIYKNSTAPTLLITDGNQTYGSDLRFELQNFKNDVYPIIVGDTTAFQDLSVSRINANKYAFLNNEFPVEIFVNYSGNRPVNIQLKISKENTTLFTTELRLTENENSKVLQLFLPASTIGVSTYTVEVSGLEGEKNLQNNLQKFAVEVIDERSTVLLLTSIFHPDLGVLKRAIETNQQREAEVRHISNIPYSLEDYSLIVLYQPIPSFEKALLTIQEQDKNSLVITGPNTDWRFLNEAQPYFKKEFTSQTEDYFAKLNNNFSAFQIVDLGFSQLPPLVDYFGEIKVSPQAEIILFQEIQGIQTEVPLLGTIEEGRVRTAFLFGSDLWKWRSQTYTSENSFETFDNFLGSLVQYLASNARKQRISVNNEPVYYANEDIVITALYLDSNYIFDPRAKLVIELTNNETEEIQSIPLALLGNKYQVEMNHLKPGDYSFRIIAETENLSAVGKFTVIGFNVEDQFTSANLSGLNQIAERKDGKLYFLDKPEVLKEMLLSYNNYSAVQKSQQNYLYLIDWYYLLAILVLSFSAEWFLRKYHGLI